MTDQEMSVRAETVALPRTKELTLKLLGKLLDLSEIQEIVISPGDITVSRRVAENVPVVPSVADEDIDGDYVLHHLADDLEEHVSTDEHPLLIIRDVMSRITLRGLRPNWILAPSGGWVEAFFGLPEEPPATHVFGMRIIPLQDQEYRKLVVVGSPTNYLSDAAFGVIVDMGV